MRCYPKTYISSAFVHYLKSDNTKWYHSLVSNADVSYPGYFFIPKNFQGTKVTKYRSTPKIVVIVNEYTQSQAEDVVMGFQTIPSTLVIGSTTAGADGRIIYFKLPGNIQVAMSSVGVYYLDGSDAQRVGVKIDEVVKPSIAGIKAGRDELLERAIEIINESDSFDL